MMRLKLLVFFSLCATLIAFSGGSPAKTEPTRTLSSSAADGQKLFANHCAICHGKNGRGLPNWKAKGQADWTNAKWQQSRTDAQLGAIIEKGKGTYMPGWKSKLSQDEIAALIKQIRAFGKKKK